MTYPYLFAIPDYTRTSAGIRVLHRLCHLLNEKGYDAYSITPVRDPALSEKYANKEVIRYISLHGIVLYPEVIAGNPLKARRVVRYLGNAPGLLGGESSLDPSEVVFGYNEFLRKYMPSDDRLLKIPPIETEIFNNQANRPRSKKCFYVGKGTLEGATFNSKQEGLTEITREGGGWPPTRKELAELLKSSSILYSYDNFSSLLDEARLCGCPVVILHPRKDAGAKEYLEQGLSIDGLAFGINPSEIERAEQTVGLYYDWYINSISSFKTQLDNFITITQDPSSYPGCHYEKDRSSRNTYFSLNAELREQVSFIRQNADLSPGMNCELSSIFSLFQNGYSEALVPTGIDPNQNYPTPKISPDHLLQIMAICLKVSGINFAIQGKLTLGTAFENLANYARQISARGILDSEIALSPFEGFGETLLTTQSSDIDSSIFSNATSPNGNVGKSRDAVNSSMKNTATRPEKQESLDFQKDPQKENGLPEHQNDPTEEISEAELMRAAKNLAEILSKDDLIEALETHKAYLDKNLLFLVRKNAVSARQNGETSLAEGLEDLSLYIQSIIQEKVQEPVS